jgi:hypothetical protein
LDLGGDHELAIAATLRRVPSREGRRHTASRDAGGRARARGSRLPRSPAGTASRLLHCRRSCKRPRHRAPRRARVAWSDRDDRHHIHVPGYPRGGAPAASAVARTDDAAETGAGPYVAARRGWTARDATTSLFGEDAWRGRCGPGRRRGRRLRRRSVHRRRAAPRGRPRLDGTLLRAIPRAFRQVRPASSLR